MDLVPGLELPLELEIRSAGRSALGETNDVFLCQGSLESEPIKVYSHFAFWCQAESPADTAFDIQKARETVGLA